MTLIVLFFTWIVAICVSSPFILFLEYSASNETIHFDTNETYLSTSNWCGLNSNTSNNNLIFFVEILFIFFILLKR